MNFWENLKKPITILAPMSGVTDTVFRQIVNSVGRPDVFFTEFVQVDALFSRGGKRALDTLRFDPSERPIVAQIWGYNPENFHKAAKLLKELGFDGIDINMGCPDKNVVKKGAGAALIKNPLLAKEIIAATISGADGLPVSVKTRIGFDKIVTDEWIPVLLQMPISALTLHLRTAHELSKVAAHWEEIRKVVEIKKKLKSEALIIGNGDIKSIYDAQNNIKKYGIDGVMVGRGIFDNVWFFNENIDYQKVTLEEKVRLLIKHLELYKKIYADKKDFALMKKFVKCYINNFRGATKKREILMKSKTMDELMKSSGQLLKKIALR